MTAIRVRKQGVKIDAWIQPDGFDICLQCWKEYMQSDDRDLSASRMLLQAGDTASLASGYESDPYSEQRKADYRIGEATDAMIDSLSRLHIWAIYKGYGIGQVWNFPNADFIQTLAAAKSELEKKLKKNVATSTKF